MAFATNGFVTFLSVFPVKFGRVCIVYTFFQENTFGSHNVHQAIDGDDKINLHRELYCASSLWSCI